MEKDIEACYSEYFEVLNRFNIKIKVQSNPFKLELRDLFSMAYRINKKRSFLFVSTVLGKHIPASPKDILRIGCLLYALYISEIYGDNNAFNKAVNELNDGGYQSLDILENKEKYCLNEKTLIITFAETATALGHMVFDNFKGNIDFIHTTREDLSEDFNRINFKEEHSHATDQILYPINIDFENGYSRVVLIDDEFTTGKTCLNIIREINKITDVKKYVLISVLEWRNQDSIDAFCDLEKEIDCEIEFISVVKGEFCIEHTESDNYENDVILNEEICSEFNLINLDFKEYTESVEKYCDYTGRFGMNPEQQEELLSLIKENANKLKQHRTSSKASKTLVLGTGEFMYIPLMLANEMGEGIFYHSTTRSPIFEDNSKEYPIKNKYAFINPCDLKTINYIYNVPKNFYDEVYIIFETTPDINYAKQMLGIFKVLGIKNINLVVCDGGTYE